jgi:chemotaxis protein MotB
MARRPEKKQAAGSPAWMSTFSDLMNLLLCFFVLLFSMSTTDVQKFNEFAASMAASFSIFSAGGSSLDEGLLISSGVSQLSDLSEYYTSMGENEDGDLETNLKNAMEQVEAQMTEESQEMAEDISEQLDQAGLSSEVEVMVTSSYVMLNMNGGILFDSGTADLKNDAKKILTDVGGILKSYDGYVIEIIGHTDNVPIHSAAYPDNQVLSMYRAYSVFQFLKNECGLDPAYMKSSGRGEYVPIADNTSAEGRAQNRRVEIKIYNSFTKN